MKKFAIFLLLLAPFMVKATTYTSVGRGGNWSTPSTWSPSTGVPGVNDIAIIAPRTTVSINANESIYNLTIDNGGTLEFPLLGTSTLTVYGNFTDNGTFTNSLLSTGTVTFAGSSNQSISGSSAPTFYNLTIDPSGTTDTTFLNTSVTVTNALTVTQGALDAQTNSITGGGLLSKLSLAAGTSLLLGLPSSNISVSFPTGFTTTTLNATSTVIYQANTSAQNISTTPTYGNLVVSSAASPSPPITKTPTGSPLTIAGNLTVRSPTTLSETTHTINLTGNATIGGALSFSTGTFNITGSATIGGALSFSSGALNIAGNFINNGTYTSVSGTTTFDGSAQTIGGTAPTTFYNLTIGTGSTVTINTSGYNVTVAGNFTNNATFTQTSGTFTMDGSGKTLGGTSAATFNNLTIASPSGTTITLGNNETITSNLLLSSGTLAASTHNLTIGGNFTNNSTSFTPGTGTVIMDGTSTQTIGGSVALSFYNLTIATGSTVTATGANLTISNVFNNNSTFLQQNTGSFTMDGGTIEGSGSTTVNTLTIASGTTTLATNIATTSNITINSGATFTIPSTTTAYTIYTKGNFIDDGTFTADTKSTVNFDNMGNQCISGTSSSTIVTFNNLTVSPVSILGTSCVVNVDGTVTILPGGEMACACN